MCKKLFLMRVLYIEEYKFFLIFVPFFNLLLPNWGKNEETSEEYKKFYKL